MESNWPSYRRPTLEADDIMGILSTHPTLISGRKIIVSEDKDMKTIPGWLFNPAKDVSPHMVTVAYADSFHLFQAICGDVTDGYVGCPGAGPKAANDLLGAPFLWEDHQYTFTKGARKGTQETRWRRAPQDLPPTPWEAITALYRRYGLTERDALVQAQVARICRASDYDFKSRRVTPWTPSMTTSH